MPHHPVHPPFLFSLTKMHGDYVMPNGGSSASEGLALGGHLGTHIDALCHFSCGGKLHGGHEVAASQSYSGGMTQLSVDTLSPMVRRGVLLDIAGQQKVASLPAAFEITPEHMETAARAQAVEIKPGDVVLLRTGWGAFFEDVARFESQMHGPGPAEQGARWLSSKGSLPPVQTPSILSRCLRGPCPRMCICWWRAAFISSSALTWNSWPRSAFTNSFLSRRP